jgi:hypothetical protein
MYTEKLTNLHVAENISELPAKPYAVKMFIHQNPREAEGEIQLWLQQNSVTLHHVSQSQSEKGGNFIFIITLIYST